METGLYEDVVMECAQLLERASTVDSEENREAVRTAGGHLRFSGLEMKRMDSEQNVVLQSIRFLEPEKEHQPHSREYCYREGNGNVVVYTIYAEPEQNSLEGDDGKRIEFFVSMLHLANERQELIQDAYYYRYHDPQTKHTNMAYFCERCETYIKNGTIGDYTAMSANLMGFTNLNFLIGSSNCDIVLIKYLDSLKKELSEDEVVSRSSGDQFALLIRRGHEAAILEKLRGMEIRYGSGTDEAVNVSAEAGIFRLTSEVGSHHHIIQGISSALNVAKNSLQIQFAYYDPMSADEGERRRYYELEFEKALCGGDIHVFYQPKVSLKNYDLIGAEALSRWIVDGKIVPPDSFVPILEETTKICELDFYVLNHVCRSIQSWIEKGLTPVKVSVNFSRRHLSNANLVEDIVGVVDSYGVPHEYIEVELTETTVDADFAQLKKVVYGLRDYGIESSVDDFGMGYSSLSLIRDVPFKVLKIDKSFLGDKNQEPDERQRAMMKHVISMANDLGMECIAEGVESMEHVQLLKECKCYMAQGYLFNKPIPREEFETVLRKRNLVSA